MPRGQRLGKALIDRGVSMDARLICPHSLRQVQLESNLTQSLDQLIPFRLRFGEGGEHSANIVYHACRTASVGGFDFHAAQPLYSLVHVAHGFPHRHRNPHAAAGWTPSDGQGSFSKTWNTSAPPRKNAVPI